MPAHTHVGHEEIMLDRSSRNQVAKKLAFWASVALIGGSGTTCIDHALYSKSYDPSPNQSIKYGGQWTSFVKAKSKDEVAFLYVPIQTMEPQEGQLFVGGRGFYLRAKDPSRFNSGTLYCSTTYDEIGSFEISGSAKDLQTAKRTNRLQVTLIIDDTREVILMHRPDAP